MSGGLRAAGLANSCFTAFFTAAGRVQAGGGLLGWLGATDAIAGPLTTATPLAPCPCSAPAVAADPVNAVTGVAHCTKPATGGPYVNYELTVCVKGTTNCLQNLPLCPISGSGTVTDCPINGCEPLTTYEVTIYALKADNTKSPISNKDDFQTPAAP